MDGTSLESDFSLTILSGGSAEVVIVVLEVIDPVPTMILLIHSILDVVPAVIQT